LDNPKLSDKLAVYSCSMKVPALTLCLLLVASVPARADEPPATLDRNFIPPGEKDVSRVQLNALVAQLADGDASEQQKAHEQLVSLLADAVPRLELLIRESKDQVTQDRARAVLADIRKRARLAPSVITLHATGGPVELLTEMFRQANLPMAKYPLNFVDDGSAPPVTVNFDRRPFWSAVKEVCEASHIDVRRVYDDDRLTVTRGEAPPVHGPSVIHGPAIVYAENAGPASKIGAENRTGQFRLCVYVEPRLRVVGLTTDFDLAVDENGDSLLPANFNPRGVGPLCDTDFAWQRQFPVAPTRFSRKIARLKGTMHLKVQTDAKLYELPIHPGAKPVHREIGGYTFDVLGLDAGEGCTLKLKLFRGNLEPWQWNWFREPMRRARVVDENGVPLRVSGSGTSAGDKTAECSITFSASDATLTPATGKPAKLVWELPTASEQLDVPFELIDVGLPIEEARPN
jgi:hypothetical protein